MSDSVAASASSASSREGHLSWGAGIDKEESGINRFFFGALEHEPVVGKVRALKLSVELDGCVDRLDSVAGQHKALDVGVERDGDDVEVGASRARGRPQGRVARAGVRAEAACGSDQETDHDGRRGRCGHLGSAGTRAHASAHAAPSAMKIAAT